MIDYSKYTFLVELIHSTSKYEEQNVVLSSTIIHGKEYWDSNNNAYIVFPNPKYIDDLAVRVTMTTPTRTLISEESVIDVDIPEALEVSKVPTAEIPEYPEQLITQSMVRELRPRLTLDFLAKYPLIEGLDLCYSGGGDRLLFKDDTYVKQSVNKLVPSVVELAGDYTNLIDITLQSLTGQVPTGWSVSGGAVPSTNYSGYTTLKYADCGMNSWLCKIYNYEGNFIMTTPIYNILNISKGMLFVAYCTLTSDIDNDIDIDNDDSDIATVDNFSVSLIFYDSSDNILSIAEEEFDTEVLNTTEPVEVSISLEGYEIPSGAVRVAGSISLGEFEEGNNVTLTVELPQLTNAKIVTYPVIRHRLADNLYVSNRNIKTSIGSVSCEFIATHNRENYYFDSRLKSKNGFAGYFNGGKLGFIVNDGSATYEIQAKWQQKWYDAVLDKDIIELPTSPSIGDRYLIFIKNQALGSHINQIAEYVISGWVYTIPIKGSAVWISDESKAYVFDGVNWTYFEAEEEGRSSVSFTWDSVNNVRKIYGNGILLGTDAALFNTPIKTNNILIGCDANLQQHINTKIIKFIISEYSNSKVD